jgi:hypothetical protein
VHGYGVQGALSGRLQMLGYLVDRYCGGWGVAELSDFCECTEVHSLVGLVTEGHSSMCRQT